MTRLLRRAKLLALAVVPLVLGAAGARAQDFTCEEGDREVARLEFTGNASFRDDDLAMRVNTTPSNWVRRFVRFAGTRRCLDQAELARDVIRLRRFYRDAGFFEAAVDTVVRPVRRGQIAVQFAIREGPPVVVDSFVVAGLDSVPDPRRITDGLWTRAGRPYNTMRLGADQDSIVARLRNAGYPRASLARSHEIRTDLRTASIEIVVIPGPRTRFGGVVIDSRPVDGEDQQVSDATVRKLMGIEEGDVYRQRSVVQAQRALYQTGAYRHVSVSEDAARGNDSTFALRVGLVEDHMRELNTEIGWATLDCVRSRGQLTDKNFMGGARRLELSGQLSKVGFGRPLATDWTRRFVCDDALVGDSVFSGTTNYYIGATLRDPMLFGRGAAPVFRVYRERRSEYRAFLRSTLIGGEASLSRNFGRFNTPFRLSYTYEYGRTTAEPAVLCFAFQRCDQVSREQITADYKPIAIAAAGVTRARVDNNVAPRRGTVVRLEGRTSHEWLGSNAELTFNKLTAEGALFMPGGWGNVFALRLRGGIIAGGALSGLQDATRLPPPQERLYAGGSGSVRGYQQNELGAIVYIAAQVKDSVVGSDTILVADGPRVRRTAPVGGNTLAVANLEYRMSDRWILPELLQYTLFLDVGQVWNRGAAEQAPFAMTPGLGVRVFSPLGPIQVNIGYNGRQRPSGPAYYDLSLNRGEPPGQLYCVSPGNRLRVSGGVQAAGDCPSDFAPSQPSNFLQRLTFTFSVGPEF